jgi:RNA-directed DNA polymerase
MDGHWQSDARIVPAKDPNKPPQGGAEGLEGRRAAKGKADEQPTPRTQGREDGVTLLLQRLREAVQRDRKGKLTALYHHVYNVEYLREAYFSLKRHAAAGVDGQSWQDYGQDLEAKLQDLSQRLRRGAYQAPPVRRVYLPKPDGRLRPIGIPTLEDKLVQWVTAQLCSTIWEEEFLGFSYGFRPGRNPHNALDALVVGIQRKHVNWVLDADIRAFFDSLSHEWLVRFVQHRIGDRRVVGLIQQWLKAGVLEDGKWTQSEDGSPQGGIISPVLANVYLHYVFDLWAHRWRKQKARGDMILVRYADDFVVGFKHRAEAERFQRELTARLGEFKLELQTDKTRLLEWGRFAARQRAERGEGKPETFSFLGFTFICGRTREGGFSVLRQTMQKRLRAKLQALKQELRQRREAPIPEQGKWLRSVLLGHYRYYGVPMNGEALRTFRSQVIQLWQQALRRRSQRGRATWERMSRLAQKWLPGPKIYHPYPSERLLVKT